MGMIRRRDLPFSSLSRRESYRINVRSYVVPKMKTVKALKAKFTMTASGKLKRNRPGKRHLLTKKSSKRKHHLTTPAFVHPTKAATYKVLMGI